MVLKLLKYVKSAMKNFDQSEATFGSHMTTMEASYWLNFFIADLTYLSNSKTILPLGQILIRALFQYFVLRKPTCKAHVFMF